MCIAIYSAVNALQTACIASAVGLQKRTSGGPVYNDGSSMLEILSTGPDLDPIMVVPCRLRVLAIPRVSINSGRPFLPWLLPLLLIDQYLAHNQLCTVPNKARPSNVTGIPLKTCKLPFPAVHQAIQTCHSASKSNATLQLGGNRTNHQHAFHHQQQNWAFSATSIATSPASQNSKS